MKKEFAKKLFYIALPITIQSLISTSVNMVDTFMIGKLGEYQIAALGVANQIFFIFNLLAMGLFSGSNVLISQYYGFLVTNTGEKIKVYKNKIKEIMGYSMVVGIFTALIFIAALFIMDDYIIKIFNDNSYVIKYGLDYLYIVIFGYLFTAISLCYGISYRSIGKSYIPMVTSFIAVIINIILNYVLIFGKFGAPVLGVKGAAIATLIARIIEAVLLIAIVHKSTPLFIVSISNLKSLKRSFVKQINETIMPVVVNEMCWGFGMVVYAVIYGRIGVTALASIQICTSIQNVFMVLFFGISHASCVMIANKIGEDDMEGTKIYSAYFLKTALGIGVSIGILLFLSKGFILSFFDVSSEVYRSSDNILMLSSFIFPIRFINILLIVGILRGGGDTKAALYFELITMWLIGVPAALAGAFVFKLGVEYVYGLVLIEEFIKFFCCLIRYRSFKWINNLTTA